ncbi:hypothetical protein Vadar_017815 [Vaccinium darrowii]|uniref:Uncharacterized protein n=1 Tax=Vaccinium darrowii TaxID=229202 RepID=A0ACB7YED9_9ERIC|nr:hypothetical protein Vadar_017815 [Vaccinium darrowii]
MPPIVPVADPRVHEVPDTVVPDQWRQLVEYRGIKEVQDQAKTNSTNRELRGPPCNTGRSRRTHFADIRNEMASNGERLDKMIVFTKTRNSDGPDVIEAAYNVRVDALLETERTVEARDEIFHSLIGKDSHGYCRTYGGGVPRSAVYNSRSSSQATGPSLVEIEQRIKDSVSKVEYRLTQQFTTEVHDASSGHRACTESVGDGLSPLEQTHTTTPPPIQRLNEQVIGVYLLNSGIPKEDVGEGLLITMDPMSEMDGKPLGEGYCKVLVEKANKPTANLERPRLNLLTVGNAVGRYVAWRYPDVIEKEVGD